MGRELAQQRSLSARQLAATLALAGCGFVAGSAGQQASAATINFKGTGSSSAQGWLWSDPVNWSPNSVPGSADLVQLSTSSANTPHSIDLDVVGTALVQRLAFGAAHTTNRAYTINSSTGATLRFTVGSEFTLTGGGAPVTFNVPLEIPTGVTPFSTITTNANSSWTFNQPIGQQGGTPATNTYLKASAGTYFINAPVNLYEVRMGGGSGGESGELVAGHAQSLGLRDLKLGSSTAPITFSLASDATVARDLALNGNISMRLREGGDADRVLTVNGRLVKGAATLNTITIADNVATDGTATGASTGNVIVRVLGTGNMEVNWATADGSVIEYAAATGATSIRSGISGAGSVLISGAGSKTLYNNFTFTHTGGTTIDGSSLTLAPGALLPTTGALTLKSGGTLVTGGQSVTLGSLAGSGSVTQGAGTVTLQEGIAPGTAGGAGTLTLSGTGDLLLSDAGYSLFDLGAASDLVTLSSTAGLTLDGLLFVNALSGFGEGSYTLFDLNGGSVSGAFNGVVMPAGYLGSIDTVDGDVVLNVTAASVAVPEPAAMSLAAGALLWTLGRRRTRSAR